MKRHGPRDVAAVTPMDLLLAFLHLAAFVGLGFGLAMPRARRLAMGLLGLAAATGFGMAVTGPERRTLTTVHTYAGFEGDAQEVSMVSFPTGTVEASGTAWALVFGVFAALWILVLWSLKDRPLRNALVLPLLFAWSATATWLGMQMVAAPAEVVQPLGLDRFLYPAGLAVADSSTGLYAALGIMAALLERERSGQGQWVHASLLHSQIAMMDFQAARYLNDGVLPATC